MLSLIDRFIIAQFAAGHLVPRKTRHSKLLIVVPTLVSALVIGISQAITIVLHIISEPLHITDLLADPAGDILGRVLNIVDSIVPLTLDAIAEAIKALLHVLGDLLDFAYTAARPFGGVFREVRGRLLESGFVFVPVLFCDLCQLE